MSATAPKAVTLSELRVFELKEELEKRGLDKSGIKLALAERLEAAIREDGHDPKTYVFTAADAGKTPGSPVKEPTIASTEDEAVLTVNNGINVEEKEVKDVKADASQTDKSTLEASKPDSSVQDAEPNLTIKTESACEDKEVIECEEKEVVECKEKEVVECIEKEVVECEDKEMIDSNEFGEGKLEVDEMDVSEDALCNIKLILDEQLAAVDEDLMKDEAEEVNYEDDDICDIIKADGVDLDVGKVESNLNSGDNNFKKPAEKSQEEKGVAEKKSGKENVIFGASAAETVESMPAAAGKDASQRHSSPLLKRTSNSLWIKGIGTNIKAADLKALFAKYGRVTTAKIFTRRQQPSNACFGFVTMVDTAAAEMCIQKLHKTSVKGHVISVERADRCNMPSVRNSPKKGSNSSSSAATAAADAKNGKSSASGGDDAKKDGKREAGEKAQERAEQSKSSGEKAVSSGAGATGRSGSLKVLASKRSPVKAPSVSSTHSNFSKHSSFSSRKKRHATTTNTRPVIYRGGRRMDRGGYISSARRAIVTHHHSQRPIYSKTSLSAAAAGRRSYAISSRSLSSRIHGRGSSTLHPRLMVRREVSSRRVESSPSSSWGKREMLDMLRKKEEEHRLKEQELRLQRERERLKFERERFERERLELQQLRQIAALTAPTMQPLMVAAAAASAAQPQSMQAQQPSVPHSSRRSHDAYDNINSSSSRRADYSRRTSDRSSSHRAASSAHGISSDRHESRSSNRHVPSGTHLSNYGVSDRSRERDRVRDHERERSKRSRDVRDYTSSNSVRDPAITYASRESYNNRSDSSSSMPSAYARDTYRSDPEYAHQSSVTSRVNDSSYNRDVSSYAPTYTRDIVPSSYSKDTTAGYGSSSRSMSGAGSGSQWPSSGSVPATYLSGSGSRDYDSTNLFAMPSSQTHGISGSASAGWSSRTENWSTGGGGSSGIQDTHASPYDKYDKQSYDKYNSYDKYSRRY